MTKAYVITLAILLPMAGATFVSAAVPSVNPETISTLNTSFFLLLGGQLVIVLGVLQFAKKQVGEAVRAELAEPEGALGRHLKDENAHELMRKAMMAEINAQFEKINHALTRNDDHLRSAFREFQSNIVTPLMAQSERTMNLIEKLLDRERRFTEERSRS